MVSTIVALLRQRAAEQQEQRGYTFLSDSDDKAIHLTYQELDRQAQAIATSLQLREVQGKRALLLYPPGLDYIAAFFGCLYAGAIPVPAYPPDLLRLNRTLPRLQAVVADSQATIVLTTEHLRSVAALVLGDSPDLTALRWCATDGVAAEEASAWQAPEITAESLAFLQYTSGSTGQPKGVMLSHGNLLHNLASIHAGFAVTPASKGVIWLPPYHDMGLIGGILQPLFGGFPVVLLSPLTFLRHPIRWLQAITRYRATISGGPNFAYDLCVRKISPDQRASLDLGCWTVAFNGAEPIRSETLDRFTDAFASCGFRRSSFYPCYGLAEATLIVAGGAAAALPVVREFDSKALGRGDAAPIEQRRTQAQLLVSSGRPLADQRLLIVHPADRKPCIPGQIGEIWIAGPSVAQGYWRQPEATSATFQAAPSDESPACDAVPNGFLRTGDLGFLLDGELFITGRIKDLIIIRGRNHHPQDLERTAERQVAALRPGCGAAFAVEIEGEERLVLVYEANRSVSDLEAVALAIRTAIAEQYELQVYCVCLLAVGSLPKTSSGKVQRYACRAGFLNGDLEIIYRSVAATAPTAETVRISREMLLHLDPAERYASLRIDLHLAIARILDRDPAELAPQQPLVSLGIDSLRAVELQRYLEDCLALTLPVGVLLDNLTIDQIAACALELLDAGPGAGDAAYPPAPQPASQGRRKMLSSAQRRLWFMDQLAPGRTAYHIPVAVRLRGRLHARALAQSLDAIVERHEILRTTFHKVKGQPEAVVGPPTPARIWRIDLQTLPAASRTQYIDALAAAVIAEAFDLARDSLLRVVLIRLGGEEHVLVLTMHHIIADGWSMGIFLGELAALYRAFVAGEQPALDPLPMQYADFAYAQQQWIQAGGLSAQEAYWRRQLAGAPPTLDLPNDFPRPATATLRGAHHFFTINPATRTALESFGRERGATLYMTLLSAFVTLLHLSANQEDIVVGADLASRHWPGTERLIGLFVNQLILRIDLSSNPSMREALRRVRQAALDAYARPDVPFDRLVELLKPARDPSRNPLFQVMFVLENAPLPPLELSGLRLELCDVDSGGAPFDLSLLISEAAGGLKGDLRYSTDLFKATTITRMAEQFRTLLDILIALPERSFAEVRQLVSGADQRQQAAQIERLRATRWEKFERIKQRGPAMSEQKARILPGLKRRAVGADQRKLVETSAFHPEQPLPLVLRPTIDGIDPIEWAINQRDWIEAQLLIHGGLLFRDFDLKTVDDFERFVGAVSGGALRYQERSSPRSQISGNIYTSTDHPADQSIFLHNEQSYNLTFPLRIFFFCITPAAEGGETPIADSRRIFTRLDPSIRERFIRRQYQYIRNFGDGLGLGWQSAFQTDDRRAVERYCQDNDILFEWKEGERLRTRQVRRAVARHPRSGELAWFNHLTFFHISTLDPNVQARLRSSFHDDELPNNTLYGDGAAIEPEVIEQLYAAYQAETIAFPWQKSDLLMLDNMLVAHGRGPFVGPRKVVVAMAEPWQWDDVAVRE